MGDVRRDGIEQAIDRALDHVAHCEALVIDCDIDVIDRGAIARRAGRAAGRDGGRGFLRRGAPAGRPTRGCG